MKKKDEVMGDKINIHNSAIGAIGRGAVNYGDIKSTSGDYDYSVMLEEIRRLKDALYSMPQSDAQILALSDVIRAEEAAASEDGQTLIGYLKKLGPWVFDLARDIGVNIISGFIGK